MKDSLIYQIALTLLPEIGAITARRLVSYCGGVEAVFTESIQNLRKIPGISNNAIHSIKHISVMKEAEAELKFITDQQIKTFFYLDDAYPNRLKHCADSPILLYYKGESTFNYSQVLSIVGTRQPSQSAQEICDEIIANLNHTDTLIVSGLAYGIDACAHKSALKYGISTIGVLGHGLDRIYPAVHRKLADSMMHQGGILTEFRKGTIPERENFPQRNRIVAGMADATLVVESRERGGSLITANLAFNYNRDVLAIPGRPTDPLSQGCNLLIQRNIAQLVQSADDIKRILNWEQDNKAKAPQKQLFVELDDNDRKVVDVMKPSEDISIDEISIDCGLSMSKTAAILLNLEFKGLVKTLPGKRYRLA
jgi:DNA processing protein